MGSEICTLRHNELSISAPGEIHVLAKQDGDERYYEADPVTKIFNVNSGIEDILNDCTRFSIEGTDLIIDDDIEFELFTLQATLYIMDVTHVSHFKKILSIYYALIEI